MSRGNVDPDSENSQLQESKEASAQPDLTHSRGGGFVLRSTLLFLKILLGVLALTVLHWQVVAWWADVDSELILALTLVEFKVIQLLAEAVNNSGR